MKEKTMTVRFNVTMTTHRALQRIAERERRSICQVASILLERGVAQKFSVRKAAK